MEGSIEAGGDAGASSGGGGAAPQHPLNKSQGIDGDSCWESDFADCIVHLLMRFVDGEAEINSESGLEEETIKSGEISIRRSRYRQSRTNRT